MYTLPATLTIKNLKKAGASQFPDNSLWNTGLGTICTGEVYHEKTLDDCIPDLNTEKYEGTIQIPVYGNCNQYYVLAPEETMTLTVATDAEAIFYLQMAEEGVLEVTPVSA